MGLLATSLSSEEIKNLIPELRLALKTNEGKYFHCFHYHKNHLTASVVLKPHKYKMVKRQAVGAKWSCTVVNISLVAKCLDDRLLLYNQSFPLPSFCICQLGRLNRSSHLLFGIRASGVDSVATMARDQYGLVYSRRRGAVDVAVSRRWSYTKIGVGIINELISGLPPKWEATALSKNALYIRYTSELQCRWVWLVRIADRWACALYCMSRSPIWNSICSCPDISPPLQALCPHRSARCHRIGCK